MWRCTFLHGHRDFVHVIPVDDLVEHEETTTCICGPVVRRLYCDDGSLSTSVTHHPLDARAA
jgi:hypothetical protein